MTDQITVSMSIAAFSVAENASCDIRSTQTMKKRMANTKMQAMAVDALSMLFFSFKASPNYSCTFICLTNLVLAFKFHVLTKV